VNIGSDSEVPADEKTFAFGDVELIQVVGNAVFESGIVYANLPSIAGQIEVEQVPSRLGGS
jgi:hypothetical protein